jgi:nuclear transport factor 2 (NTF2) superfamily protein
MQSQTLATLSMCERIWSAYRRDWNACDVDAILSGFASDAAVKYGDLDPIAGLDDIRRFLQARFARMADYRVEKVFQCFAGNVAGGTFNAEWTDRPTGKRFHARGAEFVTFRQGKCVDWICAVSPREVGAPPSLPIL